MFSLPIAFALADGLLIIFAFSPSLIFTICFIFPFLIILVAFAFPFLAFLPLTVPPFAYGSGVPSILRATCFKVFNSSGANGTFIPSFFINSLTLVAYTTGTTTSEECAIIGTGLLCFSFNKSFLLTPSNIG